MQYTPTRCARSLEILNRMVMLSLHPDQTATTLRRLISRIRKVARTVLEGGTDTYAKE